MSACSCWPEPIVAASQKSALGTKVVTTEEWPGPAAGVVTGHCALSSNNAGYFIPDAMTDFLVWSLREEVSLSRVWWRDRDEI